MNKNLRSSLKIFAYILAALAILLFIGRFYSYGMGSAFILTRWVIVALCLLIVILLRFQNSKIAVYALLGVVFIYCTEWAWYHLQYKDPHTVEEPSPERQAKFLTQNLRFLGGDAQKTLQVLHRASADVLVVQEMTPDWQEKLITKFDTLYPYKALHPMNGVNGLGIFSKYKIENAKIIYSTENRLMAQSAQLSIHGERVNLYHIQFSPLSPLRPGSEEVLKRYRENIKTRQKEWEHLDELITYEATKNAKVVIIGDANTSDFELLYQQIRKKYIDVFGFTGISTGLNYPYGERYPPFPLFRLDYIFVNENIIPIASECLKESGSDHLPFSAILEF